MERLHWPRRQDGEGDVVTESAVPMLRVVQEEVDLSRGGGATAMAAERRGRSAGSGE